jgi:Family of unknown function (DUF5906)
MNLKPASAETIARILGECTVTAGGFKCKCPAHDDKQASLQINIVGSRDGKTTVHCYAGCKPVDIFKAIEDKTGYYFESRVKKSVDKESKDLVYPATIDWPPGLAYNGIPHSVAYPYYDADNNLMFVVARWNLPGGAKRILPYSVANTGGQPKWISKLRLTPRPMFNLVEVLAHPEKPIIIVEGEKAVEAAKQDAQFNDYVVVTYQGGAGNWKHTDWQYIKGKQVFLIPDNDDAGREAFVELAQHLGLNEFCKDVKIAEHPKYFPPKWDVADPWPESSNLGHLTWYDAPKPNIDFIKETITPANYLDVFSSMYWMMYDGMYHYTVDKQRWIHSQGTPFEDFRPLRVNPAHPMAKACFIGREPAIAVWANQMAYEGNYIDGVRFRPHTLEPIINEGGSKYLNSFTGFGIKPDMIGKCEIIKSYLLHVICDGDENGYTYLFNYLSHMLQFPEDRPTVAIILRGMQGTGKSAFGYMVGRLLGSSRSTRGYFTSVATIDRLTSKFNAQLAGNLAIFVEELELTKSRSMENILKSLITDPYLSIERKGKEVYKENNYARIFGASNHNHIWNVSEGERRLTVFNVSDARANDVEYFGALFDAFNDTAVMRRFMYELMDYKVDHGLVRKPLKNKARAFQKLYTKSPNKELAMRMLLSGEINLELYDKRQQVVAKYYVSREEWAAGPVKIPSILCRQIIQEEIKTGKYGESVFNARDERVSVTELAIMMGCVPKEDGKLPYGTIHYVEHGERKPTAGYTIPSLDMARLLFCTYHDVAYETVFEDTDEKVIPFPKAKQTEPPF